MIEPNEQTHDLRPAARGPEPEADEMPTAGPLIMLAGDDEVLCIDDTCVPAGTGA
jgi:hypothetical protein